MKVSELISFLNKHGARMEVPNKCDDLYVDIDGVMLNELVGFFGHGKIEESRDDES